MDAFTQEGGGHSHTEGLQVETGWLSVGDALALDFMYQAGDWTKRSMGQLAFFHMHEKASQTSLGTFCLG